ncbi:hypothetical protein BS299_21925 [Mycobacterium tuberculosis M13]|nr:hypothetical protein BS299_21925 [Mycobacterium tuberculosis M13]SIP65816.1 hypothetical protein BN9982_2350002 [Mycobacterium tuberculosis]
MQSGLAFSSSMVSFSVAVLRLVLSEERAGLLVVRSKGIDFVTTVTVAAAMVYIASTIDPLGTG